MSLADHRADDELVCRAVHLRELGDPPEVDNVLGPSEAEVQQRHQALPARQHGDLAEVLSEQHHGIVQRLGRWSSKSTAS